MVVSMSFGGGEAAQYQLNHALTEYHLQGGKVDITWYGEGARALGLAGRASEADFLRLTDGFLPSGKPAVQNAGKPDRTTLLDVTHSAPKSVSILEALSRTGPGHGIASGHDAAVKASLDFLERFAVTRRGKGGVYQEPVGLVVALCPHHESRNGDPNLHTHALVMVPGVAEDGSTGAVDFRPLLRLKLAAGALYHCELAKQLEELGLTVVREKTWFKLGGIPEELVRELSSRRREIEAVLKARGATSAKAAELAALETRHAKETISREEVERKTRAAAEAHGLTADDVEKLFGQVPLRDPEAEARAALSQALATITRNQSHFAWADLVRHTAIEAIGRGLGAAEVLERVEAFLRESPEIVRLGRWKGEERFTTHEILELEKRLLALVESSKANAAHAVPEELLREVVAGRPTITTEQAAALTHAAGQAGSVQCIIGQAGTGKTFALSAIREAYERAGFRVLGLAPTGKAARGLADDAGFQSMTLAKFFLETGARSLDDISTAAGAGAASAALVPGQLALGPDTVLVLDEAGMVGVRDWLTLLELASKAGTKVIACGDNRQLQPVGDCGAPLAAVARAVGHATLSQIIRQRDSWARSAVKDFAAGDSWQGLIAYAEHGRLHVSEDRARAKAELITMWRDSGGRDSPESHLILAGTRAEVAELNRAAQMERHRAGKLSGEPVRVGETDLYVGDRVLFKRNSRTLGVSNGDLGTVVASRGEGSGTKALLVRLGSGRVVVVPLASYQHILLGYAVTVHAAQGVSVENAYALVGGPTQDLHSSYVMLSRHKDGCHLFCDRSEAGDTLAELSENRSPDIDLARLAQEMGRSREKELAHDLLGRIGEPPPGKAARPAEHELTPEH